MKLKSQKLTPEVYLEIIGDQTVLHSNIILTPVAWMAEKLAGGSSRPELWSANGSKIYRDIEIGGVQYDILHCLPGASMALITVDEACRAGAKKISFVGTCSSVEGKLPYGELYTGSQIVSVLNPFDEHDEWEKIKTAEVIDMEAEYLIKHALKRGISLRTALLITDAIWKDHWEQALFKSESWENATKISFEKLKNFLST
jgi:hypothetical protein